MESLQCFCSVTSGSVAYRLICVGLGYVGSFRFSGLIATMQWWHLAVLCGIRNRLDLRWHHSLLSSDRVAGRVGSLSNVLRQCE